jgi:hypothetical protein
MFSEYTRYLESNKAITIVAKIELGQIPENRDIHRMDDVCINGVIYVRLACFEFLPRPTTRCK